MGNGGKIFDNFRNNPLNLQIPLQRTLSALMFLHSYCIISSNIAFVIQRNVLVCEQSNGRHDNLQTYNIAVGRCFLGACEGTSLCSQLVYSSYFQQGFRGTSGVREWLPRVPPKQVEFVWDGVFNHSSKRS